MPVYNRYFPDANNQINTPESAPQLALEGPTILVAVSLTREHSDYLTQHGLPVPPLVTGRALIDTGATLCMIDEAALNTLGIPPSGAMPVQGVTATTVQLTYPASLSFPGTPITPIAFVDFIGGPIQQPGSELVAIIGRNVLQQWVLVYNGPGGHMSISF